MSFLFLFSFFCFYSGVFFVVFVPFVICEDGFEGCDAEGCVAFDVVVGIDFFFELAREAGELDRAEADLAQVAEALGESPELDDLIRNPVSTRAEQG